MTFEPKEYWENRLRSAYDVAGVGHIGLGKAYNRWHYRVRRHVFNRAVSWIPQVEDSRVLDIGSGTGFYVERWLELKARHITGIDMTDIAIERLRDRYPSHRFERRDIGAAGELDVGGPFDIVSAFDVLFHIVDDERYKRAFSNIRDALRAGGWFIFSENFLRHGDERARHQVSRSERTIGPILEVNGFREVYRTPMSILMDYPIAQPNRVLRNLWRGLTAPARLGTIGGHVIGAALYPFELGLTSLLHDGPSAKVVVCQRL